jgi:hypothetical protein
MNRAWSTAAAVAGLCAFSLGVSPQMQSPPTPARPIIELPKTRFASTEQVFFWVGVESPGDYVIPRSLWSACCRLTITRPDGTQHVEVTNWPSDGMLDHGWRGGAALGSEPPQAGRYTLVFEFAGQKTAPSSLTVEDVPILKDITAEFLFPSPLVLGSPDALVTLVIRNRSSETIRFPQRGGMSEGVWVGLTKTAGEKWSSSFSVPEPVLLKAGGLKESPLLFDAFSWIRAGQVPTVVLAPGGIYRLELPLHGVLAGSPKFLPIPDGEYDVRFSTTAQILVGSSDGPWADFAPFRLNIISVAHGTWPGAVDWSRVGHTR